MVTFGFGFYLTRHSNVKIGSEQGSYANCQYAVTEFYNTESFRQFLTRLVQNLTLRNDCNLIPSAHGTQQVVLSKRSLDYHQVVEFTLSCNVSFTQNFLSGRDFTLPTFSIMQSFIFDVVFPKSCESFRN